MVNLFCGLQSSYKKFTFACTVLHMYYVTQHQYCIQLDMQKQMTPYLRKLSVLAQCTSAKF